MPRRRLVLLLLLLAAVASVAVAKKVYRVVAADGSVHYTDQPPAAASSARVIPVHSEVRPIASVRVEDYGEGRRILVSNAVAGPVEVSLHFSIAENVYGNPELPLRTVVPAGPERQVALLGWRDAGAPSRYELQFEAVLGDPAAAPRDLAYRFPLDQPQATLAQGFGGEFSHRDPQSRYAIDLVAPEGTPVLAARDGVVMQAESNFEGAGLNFEKFGARANHVRVLHDDGSMAVYAHLQAGSALVREGQRVRAGQRLAASGNTGYSSGPHLHFAVQVNRGMRLESIPFRLLGPDGPVPLR